MRVFLIIIAILTFVTVTTLGASFFSIRNSLEQTVESSVTVMSEIADKFISGAINLLKARASTAAHSLSQAPMEEWPQIMQEQLELYSNFMALTVFDRNGIVRSHGRAPTPADLADSEYMRRAFAGEAVISTSRKDPVGELVFHVCVPMEDQESVLSVTVPGLYFSDLLSPYKIWDTGTLFIVDKDGTLLANERTFLVSNRYNFIKEAETNPEDASAGEFSRLMIQGKKGTGRYTLYGVERLGIFTPVTASRVNWMLGISAPISESPAAHVDQGLLLTALIFLGMGSGIAFFASGIIAKPFQIVNEQNAYLAEIHEIARNASEAKSNFLANMSHEMRTPLNAVIGFSELMLHGHADPEESRGYLEKIHNAGMILLGTVNDILDISKVESGKFTLIPVEYDIASLINDVVTMNIMRIGEKPIEFGMQLDERLPSRMIGDELRIRQLCNNLLSNAFKYTREGSVNLRVYSETDGDSVWLTISVSDTGIGIRPEDIPKLFSDYSQLDAKSNRKIEGTGLGLAITKKIVEMMDGKIMVESEYERGSTFTARIRQQFVTHVRIGAPVVKNLSNSNSLEQKNLRGMRRTIHPLPYAKVLIVDDVITNLDVARGMLKPYGMQVDCATSGRQAIDLIREEKVRYDAIFMDHMMPGMDGIEAVRIIREEIGTEYARTVPVIALTANAIVGNEQIFLRSGFQAFLSKPIDIPKLDLALKQWVRDKNRAKEYLAEQEGTTGYPDEREETTAPDKAAEAPAPGPGTPLSLSDPPVSGHETPVPASGAAVPGFPEQHRIGGLDLEECLERFGGDREALLQILRSYAANTPTLLDQVRAPSEKGLPDYTIVIHGIKSSSYGICAKLLGKKAEELEHAAQNGDFAFVKANNELFLPAAEKLLADLSALLNNFQEENRKPKKDEPDAGVLDRLREACAKYDMDGVDTAMAELESFTYESRPELTAWLRERVDMMDFRQILEKLSAR
jgi:signal transduction histidine kinase/CheY-like chemotaxis protein